MDEKKVLTLKINLRIAAKIIGGIIAVAVAFFLAFSLGFRGRPEAESYETVTRQSDKTAMGTFLPPPPFAENPPLEVLKAQM